MRAKGITWSRSCRFAYGHNFGFGVVRGHQVVPLRALRVFVSVANTVLCAVFGHREILPGSCSSCARVLDAGKQAAFRQHVERVCDEHDAAEEV